MRDIINHRGFTFRVDIENDGSNEAPWHKSDFHGPVSGWTRREKSPGELVLNQDRSSKRYYDLQGAMALAKKDGWSLCAADTAKLAAKLGHAPSKGEIRAEAVRRDYEDLRGWCNDDWRYVGVIVTLIPDDEESDDVPTDYSYAIWGIESYSTDYLQETALELAEQAVAELTDENEEVAHWANHNLATV